MRIPALPILSLIVLTACTGAGNDKADNPAASVAEGPAGVAQLTVANQLDIDPQAVTIISVAAIEFSDSSLGCPQPDMAYLAVITPGHKVMARAGEQTFDVRVAGKHGFVCVPAPRSAPKR